MNVEFIDNFLTPYGLSVLKIVVILSLFLVIYFIRKVLFDVIQSTISKIKSLKKYSEDILNSIR
ncbi:MAG: mechanosensitive ion channel family protein, partial [Sulfurimonas sp.]|nr:mechanosensitive ion channel family protein [Sulfurimonas sp.]